MKKFYVYFKNGIPAFLLGLSALTLTATIGCGDNDLEDAGEEIEEGFDEAEDELD